MKYMPLFPQSPSRRAVMPFGIDLPATGFCSVFADGPYSVVHVVISILYHACVIPFHVYASMLCYLILI